jgi:hypothetical protein
MLRQDRLIPVSKESQLADRMVAGDARGLEPPGAPTAAWRAAPRPLGGRRRYDGRCHRLAGPVLPRTDLATHPRLGAPGLGQRRRRVHRPPDRRRRLPKLLNPPGPHRALGKLDPSPDVHVDDDADDLEHLLRAEVLDERVVEPLERRVPIGVGGAGERLGVAERRPLGLGVKLSLPPCGQGVDLGPRDARLARRLVVQVQAVGAVVELRRSQTQ